MTAPYFTADWPAPINVRTLLTTRRDGASSGVFGSNNLAYHVGDDPDAVARNRQQLQKAMESAASIQWLRQVHGTTLVEAEAGEQVCEADGCRTTQRGRACAILTADCLPILLCDREGGEVAAVHAGWRGLAAGILVDAVQRFAAAPHELMVYLGPAISQPHFEVGPEVREAFLKAPVAAKLGGGYPAQVGQAFTASTTPGHWRADLYQLARSQCAALGTSAVYGGDFCTFSDSRNYYSFRRDRQTGRMASLIWLV